MQVISELLNPNNFGKYVLEVVSWENDGDHYENNVFYINTEEKLSNAIELLDSLSILPEEKSYYGEPKLFKVFGLEVHSLAELSELEEKYYEDLADDVENPVGIFGNGTSLDMYQNFVGGFQYETDITRRLDSYAVYKLDEQGLLSKIEKTT